METPDPITCCASRRPTWTLRLGAHLMAGWLLLGCPALSNSDAPAPAAEPAPLIFVIPVDGPIDKSLLYVVRRGLRQADRDKAAAIVFTIHTPGGRLDTADDIINLLLRTRVPTYTLVQTRAFSAGAMLAMATDKIYMTPGSIIGDAMPIMVSPFGGAQEMPEPMQEKAVSGVAALIRSAAQQKGHDPLLAEAMVRREMEYAVNGEIISPAGQLLTLTDTEAAQPVGEDRRPLLSSGTVADITAMLAREGWDNARIVTLEVTAAEKTARVIEALSVILLAGGLLGLYIEFRTPGFGLPGIVGLVCLAIFFWGHHIAGLAGMSEVLIFGLGVLLLLLEIFFIPGFGAAGITGIALIIFAFLSSMAPQIDSIGWPPSVPAGWYPALLKTAAALVIGGLAGLLLSRGVARAPLFRRVTLESDTGRASGFRAAPDPGHLLGRLGRTLTDLRPSGVAMFDDQRLDVVTGGEFIEKDTAVRITAAHGARLVVEAADDAQPLV